MRAGKDERKKTLRGTDTKLFCNGLKGNRETEKVGKANVGIKI